jgi:hypothetical protein
MIPIIGTKVPMLKRVGHICYALAMHMADDVFFPVHGCTMLFDVVRSGKIVGIVWQHGDAWFADQISMANSIIREATRSAAASKL